MTTETDESAALWRLYHATSRRGDTPRARILAESEVRAILSRHRAGEDAYELTMDFACQRWQVDAICNTGP